MVTVRAIPWNKYGIIAELAKRLENKTLGKVGLQKLIYFLQEIYDIDFGYRYSFYTYGPYCSELASDLEYVESLGGVEIKTVFYPCGRGYEIKPGNKNDILRNKANNFEENKAQIDSLVNEFGNLTARELELKAFLLYMNKETKVGNEEEIVKSIQSVKPYFTEKEIKEALTYMKQKDFIN